MLSACVIFIIWEHEHPLSVDIGTWQVDVKENS